MRNRILAAALLATAAGAAAAHDGDFDLAFQDQGRQRVPISATLGAGGYDAFLAIQSTGKIVLATDSNLGLGGDPDFYVKRLNADGSPDGSFASGSGEQVIAFNRGGDNADYLAALALEGDKILLAGSSNGDAMTSSQLCAIVRLDAAGVLDADFAGSGKKLFSWGLNANPSDRCTSVSVTHDDKVLVAGAVNNGSSLRMGVARLLSLGNFDAAFTTNVSSTGKIVLDFGAAELGGLALRARELPDYGILVVGEEVQATGAGWGLVKLKADGTPDPLFGSGGYVYYQLGLGGDAVYDEAPYDFVALPDSSFVVVGGAPTGTSSGTDIAIVKFTNTGAVDTSWGVGGRQIVQLDFGSDNDEAATSIALDAQGRFVVAGWTNVSDVLPAGGSDFFVLRLLPGGGFDPTFGQSGIRTVQLSVPPAQNLNQRANSVAIAPGGGIVLGGPAATTVNGAPYAIGVAKLYGDAIFAASFEP